MELYNTRAGNYSDEERRRLIFKELQDVQEEAKKRSIKTTFRSTLLWWVNTLLNLVVMTCSAAIVIINGISLPSASPLSNLPALILGGIIFVISGSDRPLKLGPRGYYYRQASYRLKRIISQARDLTYTFNNFTNEEILVSINGMRIEMDDIDLEVYKSSMPDDEKMPSTRNSMSLREAFHESPNNSFHENKSDSPSHIHIHIDSPEHSPKVSPRILQDSVKNTNNTQTPHYSKSLNLLKSKSLNNSRSSIDIPSRIRSISEPNLQDSIGHELSLDKIV